MNFDPFGLTFPLFLFLVLTFKRLSFQTKPLAKTQQNKKSKQQRKTYLKFKVLYTTQKQSKKSKTHSVCILLSNDQMRI